jgi:hypothetical protein
MSTTAASKLAASLASKHTILAGPESSSLPTHNVQAPAGIAEDLRSPGFYSLHTSKIRVGNKVIAWPIGSPLIPADEEQLELLTSLVERGLAEEVKAPVVEEPPKG